MVLDSSASGGTNTQSIPRATLLTELTKDLEMNRGPIGGILPLPVFSSRNLHWGPTPSHEQSSQPVARI